VWGEYTKRVRLHCVVSLTVLVRFEIRTVVISPGDNDSIRAHLFLARLSISISVTSYMIFVCCPPFALRSGNHSTISSGPGHMRSHALRGLRFCKSL